MVTTQWLYSDAEDLLLLYSPQVLLKVNYANFNPNVMGSGKVFLAGCGYFDLPRSLVCIFVTSSRPLAWWRMYILQHSIATCSTAAVCVVWLSVGFLCNGELKNVLSLFIVKSISQLIVRFPDSSCHMPV